MCIAIMIYVYNYVCNVDNLSLIYLVLVYYIVFTGVLYSYYWLLVVDKPVYNLWLIC
jgi:hypothetical protein